MKNFIKKILLSSLLLVAFVAISFTQEINLTFKSNYGCANEPLDSVKVENLTQGGDTVLYYPDTVLTINLSGIEEHLLNKQGFYISQNYPNPFVNETKFEVSVVDAGKYSIRVYDLSGREVEQINNELKRGIHEFAFTANYSGSYIVSVKSEKAVQKVLMICAESSYNSNSELIYNSYSSNNDFFTKITKSNFTFTLGDELKYTGYIDGEIDEVIDTPTSDALYSFSIFEEIPTEPVFVTSEIGDGTILWSWNSIQGAKAYRYNTTDDYETAIDIGLTNEFLQTFPTDIECGLKLNIFLWSYNSCGHSTSVEFEDFKEHQITDYVNNDKYQTIYIGEQCWFQENLYASLYSNGDEIQYLPDTSWYHLEVGSYDYVLGNPENDIPFGRYYSWQAVIDERNICPEGWHVPSNSEWIVLQDNLGGTFVAGEKMKIEGTDFWNSPNIATNECLFSAYPSGKRYYYNGETHGFGVLSYFWSTTEYSSESNTYVYVIENISSVFAAIGVTQSHGYSVRCLRDW